MLVFRMLAASAVQSRLMVTLVVIVGLAIPAALAVSIAGPTANLAVAQDDDDDDGDDDGDDDNGDDDDGDHNRGHGNDDDGFDEDNPGRGRGPNRDDDDDRGRGQNQDDDREQEQVAPVATFVIEIACPHDAAVDRTTCTFTGQGATEGLREIGVPAGAVCAEVVGGDYERGGFAGGPADLAEGYSSRSGQIDLVLILDGEIPHGVPVTYWVATDRGIFPAEGPSLGCAADAVPLGAAPTMAVETEADAVGVVEIRALSCGEEQPVDPGTFDWYGRCQEPHAGATFELSRLDADNLFAAGETEVDEEGIARFTELEPGVYTLDETNGIWCHAESDSVNERGEVVVEAGERVTVWTFHCGDATK